MIIKKLIMYLSELSDFHFQGKIKITFSRESQVLIFSKNMRVI